MRVAVAGQAELPLPLIAYDLPWASVAPARAAIAAAALESLGLTIAALRCELGETARPASTEPFGRLCPYRPDRYGLTLEDLTEAKLIDLRLAPCRDSNGRFTYSAEWMRRWDLRLTKTPKEAPKGAHAPADSRAAMPIRLWPPEVATVEKLPSKISQLRQVAPMAGICISLDAGSLDAGLPLASRCQADVVAVRADDWPSAHAAQLAALVLLTRQRLDAAGRSATRLVIVPPPAVTADDVVKLLALGADVVAVDGWCRPAMERSPTAVADDWAAATLGVRTRTATDAVLQVETAALQAELGRVVSLVESTGVASVSKLCPQHLTSLDPAIPGVRLAAV